MAEIERDSGAAEPAREQDGGGLNHPTPGSESARGNAPPEADTKGTGTVVHATRSFAGPDGPIEIVEDSGAAAGEIDRQDDLEQRG